MCSLKFKVKLVECERQEAESVPLALIWPALRRPCFLDEDTREFRAVVAANVFPPVDRSGGNNDEHLCGLLWRRWLALALHVILERGLEDMRGARMMPAHDSHVTCPHALLPRRRTVHGPARGARIEESPSRNSCLPTPVRHARLYCAIFFENSFWLRFASTCPRKLSGTGKIGFIAVSIVSAPPSCTRACQVDNSPAEILESQHKQWKSLALSRLWHRNRFTKGGTRMWPRSPPKTLGSCASMCLHAALTRKHRSITASQSVAGMWVIRAREAGWHCFRIVPVWSAIRTQLFDAASLAQFDQ
jgi:hypothetical protein